MRFSIAIVTLTLLGACASGQERPLLISPAQPLFCAEPAANLERVTGGSEDTARAAVVRSLVVSQLGDHEYLRTRSGPYEVIRDLVTGDEFVLRDDLVFVGNNGRSRCYTGDVTLAMVLPEGQEVFGDSERDGIRKNADKLFGDLNREEARHGGSRNQAAPAPAEPPPADQPEPSVDEPAPVPQPPQATTPAEDADKLHEDLDAEAEQHGDEPVPEGQEL